MGGELCLTRVVVDLLSPVGFGSGIWGLTAPGPGGTNGSDCTGVLEVSRVYRILSEQGEVADGGFNE